MHHHPIKNGGMRSNKAKIKKTICNGSIHRNHLSQGIPAMPRTPIVTPEVGNMGLIHPSPN